LLVDTSVLLRTAQVHHPQYTRVLRVIEVLPQRGQSLQIVAQNLIELWVVATRPVTQNGLGMSALTAQAELARVKSIFELMPETPAIYPVWEELVIRHRISGKPAHDARLVAAMHVHGIASILTFDQSGFTRFPMT